MIIPVNDDTLPEVDEYFTLNLTSVSPMDGSTPTSAASLRPGFTQVEITIQESDYPNGLLQFMYAVPDTNGTIPPSGSQFNIDTRESVGTLSLHVIRAQGTLGKASAVSYLMQVLFNNSSTTVVQSQISQLVGAL